METCSVDGCKTKIYAKGYCKRHYLQVWRHGQILERTVRDPNEFIIDGDIVRIVLFGKDHKPCGEAIIDKESLPLVEGYKWGLYRGVHDGFSSQHCGTKIKDKLKYIHSFILDGDEIDHIDHDGLNNRKSNLRSVTHQHNCFNSRPRRGNKWGLKGVTIYEKRWLAQIAKDGKNYHLGMFRELKDAIVAYNQAAERLFGEFAYLNPVREKP